MFLTIHNFVSSFSKIWDPDARLGCVWVRGYDVVAGTSCGISVEDSVRGSYQSVQCGV